MLQKIYGAAPKRAQVRYRPAVCMGARKASITGNPDHEHISTNYVERQNLTMRMNMRRFTRLTNGFSKKAENHEHMLGAALYVLQFRSHPSIAPCHASDGGWNFRPRLEH